MQLWSVEMAAIPCLLYYQLLFRKNVSNMVLRSQRANVIRANLHYPF